jgi:hypothetical protein
VDLLVLVLQLALFAGCVASGCWLLLRRDRGLGLGMLVGWVVGIIGLALGTMPIFITVPSDPQAAGTSALYSHSTIRAARP